MADVSPRATPDQSSSTRVADRRIVSEPNRVIQVERVCVSQEQRSSVATAIRTGRRDAGKSE